MSDVSDRWPDADGAVQVGGDVRSEADDGERCVACDEPAASSGYPDGVVVPIPQPEDIPRALVRHVAPEDLGDEQQAACSVSCFDDWRGSRCL